MHTRRLSADPPPPCPVAPSADRVLGLLFLPLPRVCLNPLFSLFFFAFFAPRLSGPRIREFGRVARVLRGLYEPKIKLSRHHWRRSSMSSIGVLSLLRSSSSEMFYKASKRTIRIRVKPRRVEQGERDCQKHMSLL